MLTVLVVLSYLPLVIILMGKLMPLQIVSTKFLKFLTRSLLLFLLCLILHPFTPSSYDELVTLNVSLGYVESENFDIIKSRSISSKFASIITMSSTEKCVNDCNLNAQCSAALATSDRHLYYRCLHFEHPPRQLNVLPIYHEQSVMYFKKSKAGAGISADGLYYFLSPKTMHYSEAVQFCQSHLDLYQLAQQRIDVNLWPVIGQYMKRLIEDKNDLGTGIFFDFFDVEYRGQRVRKIYGRFAKMFTNPCSGRQLARFGLLYKAFNRVLPIDDSSVKAYALCQGDILNLGGNKYEIEATPKDRGLTRIWSEENGCVEMLDPRDVMDTEVEDDYIGEEDAGELELFDEEFQPQYDK